MVYYYEKKSGKRTYTCQMEEKKEGKLEEKETEKEISRATVQLCQASS